jgi:hypothetical protein
MSNNLEDSILDYFPNENNDFEKAIVNEKIPEDFVLLKSANYSEQLNLELEQLAYK